VYISQDRARRSPEVVEELTESEIDGEERRVYLHNMEKKDRRIRLVASPDARTHARIVFGVQLQLVVLARSLCTSLFFLVLPSRALPSFPCSLARSLFRPSGRGDRATGERSYTAGLGG